jgi:hypothetical protein
MATLTFTGSTPGTFSSAINWSPAQVPTINDICIFTASSPTCSLTTIGTCSQVDFSSYNKRISFSTNALGVYGNITLGTQMSFTYATTAQYNGYNLVMAATGSIRTNGMTMGVPFGLYVPSGTGNTYTLQDNLICGENFSTGAGVGGTTYTINGFTISCYKTLAINLGSISSGTNTTGTTNIVLLGSNQTISMSNTSGTFLTNNLTINASGNVTMPLNLLYKTGTFRLLSGKMISAGTSNISLSGSATIDMSGSNSNNVQNITLTCNVTGNTITLLSDLHILGFSVTTIASTIINGSDIYAYGTTPIGSNGSSNITGTTTLRISGTSSASTATIGNSGNISINLSIQTPGTLNFNQVQWYAQSGGASIVYTSGTMLFNGSNFQIGNNTNTSTFYTSGMTFNNVTPVNANPCNINLQQQLNVTTFTINTGIAISFTGSYGFSASTLAMSGTTPTTRTGLTLVSGITYSVNRNLSIQPGVLSGVAIFGIKSNTPGQQAKFVLAPGASQSVYTVVTDDIDSSAGQPIWPYYYDVATASTNTLNWNRLQYSSLQSSILNIS